MTDAEIIAFAAKVRMPPQLTTAEYTERLLAANAAGQIDWSNPFMCHQLQYMWDCTGYVRDVIGADPDDWQCEAMDAVSDGHRQIAVRSGHGVGKTATVSWINIWFINMFDPCKAVVTAPSAGTIDDGLGAEIKLWVDRLPPPIRALWKVTGDRVAKIDSESSAFLSMRTSRPENPQTIAGIHAPHICITVDEASALPDKSFESVGGSMTSPHAVLLLIGNPTLNTGFFHDCFTVDRENWYCMHVSSENSRRVSPDYIKSMESRYGRESNTFRIRVQGEFPLGNDDSIIPRTIIEPAVRRKVEPLQVRIIWGLDVARSLNRDTSRLVKRQGNTILPVEPGLLDPKFAGGAGRSGSRHTPATLGWQYGDTAPLIGAIKAEYDNTPESQRPQVICVDGTGFGATVADVLRSMGLPAIAVNTAERLPMEGEKYYNLRAELWFKGREWFQALDTKMPDDEQMITQLAMVGYKHTPNGQILAQSKDEIRKDHHYSPDLADALILTFAAVPAMATAGAVKAIDWNKPLSRGRVNLV